MLIHNFKLYFYMLYWNLLFNVNSVLKNLTIMNIYGINQKIIRAKLDLLSTV